MNYEIVEIGEKVVAGLIKKTTNQGMQAVTDIGMMWKDFIEKGIYHSIGNKIDQSAIGLYTDYEGNFTNPYNFMACCEVNSLENINPGLSVKRIKAGKYAKFTVRGHMQKAVGEAWQEIWKLNLDRAYTTDFEVYHYNSEDMNDQIIDIYISIK